MIFYGIPWSVRVRHSWLPSSVPESPDHNSGGSRKWLRVKNSERRSQEITVSDVFRYSVYVSRNHVEHVIENFNDLNIWYHLIFKNNNTPLILTHPPKTFFLLRNPVKPILQRPPCRIHSAGSHHAPAWRPPQENDLHLGWHWKKGSQKTIENPTYHKIYWTTSLISHVYICNSISIMMFCYVYIIYRYDM